MTISVNNFESKTSLAQTCVCAYSCFLVTRQAEAWHGEGRRAGARIGEARHGQL